MVNTNWKVGDRIRLCAKVEDFFTANTQFLYLHSADIEQETVPCNITCARPNCAYGGINTSNREVVFQSVKGYSITSRDVKCSNVQADKSYHELGRATSDSSGIATLFYTVTEQDRLDYEDARANGKSYDIVICLTDPLADSANAMTFYGVTVQPAPTAPVPTHYISLSLGFVPPELVSYFQTYISQISDQLMTRIAPPPLPWQYLRTTYDGVNNAFNLWFYLPPTATLSMAPESMPGTDILLPALAPMSGINILSPTLAPMPAFTYAMSPGALDELLNWITTWGVFILGAVLIIIGLFANIATIIAVAALMGGVAILSWGIYNAVTQMQIAKTIATNLTNQLNQVNKENQAKQAAEDAWQKSGKTQADCITRLTAHVSFHTSPLNGYMDIYAKYPDFITKLRTESTAFTTNTNGIISEFKTKPYTADVCNTYIVSIDNEINSSNLRITDLLATYVPPDQVYSVPCKGWTNQADCETAECYWYDGACHKEENCWIPNPVGGCILSANTGKIIVGTVALLGILGVAYWVATRRPEEARAIITGAREAAQAEAARARAAVERFRTPAVSGAIPAVRKVPG